MSTPMKAKVPSFPPIPIITFLETMRKIAVNMLATSTKLGPVATLGLHIPTNAPQYIAAGTCLICSGFLKIFGRNDAIIPTNDAANTGPSCKTWLM